MSKIIEVLFLKKEAHLFDTKLYLLKTLAAVLAAYAIVKNLPIVQKDMISVLFGLMMTLEPVTVTGIKSGLKQISATILGALATAVIIVLFGINIWTVALSVSATLFLCLNINWREVSPVAIFTSIYMTQYVQHTVNGEPSVILTFQLRILALGLGVLIAVIFNFLFSQFFYQQMERKRIIHIMESIAEHMKLVRAGIEHNNSGTIQNALGLISATFADIDWLVSLVKDKEKEAQLRRKLQLTDPGEELSTFLKILRTLRSMNHFLYDTAFTLSQYQDISIEKDKTEMIMVLDKLIQDMAILAGNSKKSLKYKELKPESYDEEISGKRVFENLTRIQNLMGRILFR